jgi:hypothetical protein
LLGDPAVLEDHYLVGAAHGREPVRDDDRGQPAGDLRETLEEGNLCPDVQVRCRFVEHEDRRAPADGEEGARQGKALPLPAG